MIARLLQKLPALIAVASSLTISYLRFRLATCSAPCQGWRVDNMVAVLRLTPTTSPYTLLAAFQALVIHAVTHPTLLQDPVVGAPAA